MRYTLGAPGVHEGTNRELDFSSLAGRTHYHAKGDLQQQSVCIFLVQNGRFVQVKPKP